MLVRIGSAHESQEIRTRKRVVIMVNRLKVF